MIISTAITTRSSDGAARRTRAPASAFDQRGVVVVAVPVEAISALASDTEHMLDAFVFDDKGRHPGLLASLTPQKHFADAIAELEPVLTRPATTSEIQAMVCMLFDSLGQRADAGAKNRVGGYVLALMNNGLEDDDPVISATTLGLAIARQLKTAERPPLPSQLLAECISVRDKVEALVSRLRLCGLEMAVVRKQLEWEIEWRDFDFHGPGSEIPF